MLPLQLQRFTPLSSSSSAFWLLEIAKRTYHGQLSVSSTIRSMSSSIPSHMKASVLTKAAENFEMGIEQLKVPVPKANEVLIKVRASGVCSSDKHMMSGKVPFVTPAVFGHESSGTIVALGPNDGDLYNKKRLAVGQKVISTFIMPCGQCETCVRGKEDICETFFELNRAKGVLYDGTHRLFRKDNTPVAQFCHGALAEYCVVPANAVYPISDRIDHADAAIIGCAIFTAYGAVRHAADIKPGENVAVIGTGGVGTNLLQISRAFGAHRIIAIDVDDNKLKSMLTLGATHTVNVLKEDVVKPLKEITARRGVDVAFEALGRKQTFETALLDVADGGRAVMVGIAPAGATASIEITRLVRRQIRVIGSYGAKARSDVPEILKLVDKGLIDVSGAVSRRYSLENAAQAYRDLDAGKITGRAIVDLTL